MSEYICLKCKIVTITNKIENLIPHTNRTTGKECNGEVLPFIYEDHRDLLIACSNAWNSIDDKWKTHPLYNKVAEKLYKEGCCSGSAHLNQFIKKLIKQNKKLKRKIKQTNE